MPRGAFEQRKQLVSTCAIHAPRFARVRDPAKEQFASAVAIGVDGVDQFQARSFIEVVVIATAVLLMLPLGWPMEAASLHEQCEFHEGYY